MIRSVECKDALVPFTGNAFACRIRATANAYGFIHPFARFWVQARQAAMCLLDDAMILDAHPDADFDELAEFFPAVGARILLCSEAAACSLPFPWKQTGEVMALHAPQPFKGEGIVWNPSPRLLYPLLCACQAAQFQPPAFEPFYLDLSHRTRHGTACSAAIQEGNSLVACAICSAWTEDAAVLSAVAVQPEARRRGLGTNIVRTLAASLPVETFYIFRAAGENEGFYQSLGFTRHCGFAELSLQERDAL